MAIVPGFEYDIFISYRHNDNLDGWVTDFVQNLEKELKGTLKDTVTIYFDKNPRDGLLETHNVDKSLEGKLKCLIFIPIISQTYCDTKSFAWQHEFLAFNKLAKEDHFGRDIKLKNGNVSSRILPVKIHNLDEEDKVLVENELGGVLRPIDFIFKSAGVNRPLTPSDNPEKNLNKAFYRDQINKVANAVKEIVSGLKNFATPARSRPAPPSSSLTEPGLKPRTQKLLAYSAATLLLMLLAGYFIFNFTGFGKKVRHRSIEKSVAVLPFINMSNDQEQEYFSDGLTEDIITQLAKIKALKVISRTSVMQYKKNPKPIKEMAEELNVAAILEGSVQRSGDQVRITAQLINAATDEHLWAESYDRPIKDIFNVQSDVAKQIASALKATFSASEKSNIEKVPTSNIVAYNLYLKAKFNVVINSKESYRRSVLILSQAIELDKDFAPAYAELANCYSLIAYYQYDLYKPQEAWQLAKQSALKAFALDSTLAESYDALAYIVRTYDWNWAEAEKKWKKAIELNPNSSRSYHRYALLLGLQGRFDESIAKAKHALQLDPLNLSLIVDKARMHYYAGQMDKSIELANSSFDLDRDYRPAWGLMGSALEQQGLLDSSVVMISKSATRTGTDYEGVNERFESKPANYKEYWNDVLNRTLEDAKKQRISSIIMAILYMRTGNHNEALKALEKAYEDREGGLVYVNVEPLFKPLHNDPRFEKIVSSMELNK